MNEEKQKARAIASIRRSFAAFGLDASHLTDKEIERGSERVSEAVATNGGFFSVSDFLRSLSRVSSLGLSAKEAAARFSR